MFHGFVDCYLFGRIFFMHFCCAPPAYFKSKKIEFCLASRGRSCGWKWHFLVKKHHTKQKNINNSAKTWYFDKKWPKNGNGLLQEKKQMEGDGVGRGGGQVVEDILLWNPLEFLLFYFTPGYSQRNKARPLELPQYKLLLDPLEIPRPKTDPWKFHIIFSWPRLEIPLHF